MIKTKNIYVCDACREEINTPFIHTEDVEHEGSSTIQCGRKEFYVGGQHYCSLDCLIVDIKQTLGL